MDKEPDTNANTTPDATPSQETAATPAPSSPSSDVQTNDAVTPPPAAGQNAQPTGENPGQTFGVISIVLDLIGFALIGAILGYLSIKKSKESGHSTTLGTVGLWLGVVFTILGFLFFVGFAILTAAGINEARNNPDVFDSSYQDYR